MYVLSGQFLQVALAGWGSRRQTLRDLVANWTLMHAAIILPLSYLEKATLQWDNFRSRLQHVDDPE